MRYLAIDFGLKRCGLAVGDDLLKIATPLTVFTATNDQQRFAHIAQAIDEHGPDALVLGLPLNMNGTEGEQAAKARAWARQLETQFNLPVHLVDERQTSQAADDKMARSGLTHGQKKQRRDALAAAVILEAFLSRQ